MNKTEIFILSLGVTVMLIAAVPLAYAIARFAILHSVDRTIEAIDRLKDKDRDRVLQAIAQRFRDITPTQRIFAYKNAVITYAPANIHGFSYHFVEGTFTQILDAHPYADLTKHETALHIKIIDVQRAPSSSTSTEEFVV